MATEIIFFLKNLNYSFLFNVRVRVKENVLLQYLGCKLDCIVSGGHLTLDVIEKVNSVIALTK